MAKKVKVKPNDLGRYFRGIDLKGRLRVIESAKSLLEIQNTDDALIADASPDNALPADAIPQE